jgi:hypothetical protein
MGFPKIIFIYDFQDLVLQNIIGYITGSMLRRPHLVEVSYFLKKSIRSSKDSLG